MRALNTSIFIIALLGFAGWVLNAAKLADCDFASPYKCEFIHGIGLLIPPSSIITVWFDSDGE